MQNQFTFDKKSYKRLFSLVRKYGSDEYIWANNYSKRMAIQAIRNMVWERDTYLPTKVSRYLLNKKYADEARLFGFDDV